MSYSIKKSVEDKGPMEYASKSDIEKEMIRTK